MTDQEGSAQLLPSCQAKTSSMVCAVAARVAHVSSWAGSVHGPYPVGNPSAQPDMKLAIPSPEAGARDQSFRLILKPEIWGREARIRGRGFASRTSMNFSRGRKRRAAAFAL